MSRFRPCIDLHNGKVKQIVGGTLEADGTAAEPVTNFVSSRGAAYYAGLYKADKLTGGHVIMLGPGNESAALEALRAYPGGLQVGGGINPENARRYLDAGADKVIVTSCVFREGKIDRDALKKMVTAAGRDKLVLDLSCRRRNGKYLIVTDRWQRFTEEEIGAKLLNDLAENCAEFLVHAVDVEGKQAGPDPELVALLSAGSPIPTTYAGGIRDLDDIAVIAKASNGRLDYTVGSALDIFGGRLSYRMLTGK